MNTYGRQCCFPPYLKTFDKNPEGGYVSVTRLSKLQIP